MAKKARTKPPELQHSTVKFEDVGGSEETLTSGARLRVMYQILTEMDGLKKRRQVFIMASTTRLDIIDPTFLRPGRFDRKLYVGFPSPEDRHTILLTITKGEASLKALKAHADSQTAVPHAVSSGPCDLRVSKQNFEEAFKKVRPSVSKEDQLMYENLRESLTRQ